MKNAYQDGRVLDVTLEAAAISGGVVTKGALFGIAVSNGAIGDTIAVHVEGVFRLPKATGTALAAGTPVTWAAGNSNVISGAGASGDTASFGYVTEDAASAATEVLVRLTPGTAAVVA